MIGLRAVEKSDGKSFATKQLKLIKKQKKKRAPKNITPPRMKVVPAKSRLKCFSDLQKFVADLQAVFRR